MARDVRQVKMSLYRFSSLHLSLIVYERHPGATGTTFTTGTTFRDGVCNNGTISGNLIAVC